MKEPKIRFNEFKGEWKEKELNSLASYICSGKNTNMQGPYPLYGSTGIIGTTDKPYHTGPMLLVARVGANAGYLQLIEEECGVSDNTLIIQPNNELPEKYLFYYFDHFNLNRFIYGSGQPLITGGMLKKMPVRFGCTTETRKLASFFTTLDAQISASTSRLASLKQIKAASLQAMFPQEGETVPKLRFKGFEGEWEYDEIGNICKITTGKSNTQDQVPDGQYPFFIRSEKIAKSVKYLYDTEAVITIGDGNIGKVFHYTKGKFDLHQRCYMMYEFQSIIDAKYFYYYFATHFYDRAIKMSAKATVDSVRLDMIAKMEIKYPSFNEQRAIASFFTNLDRQITLQSQRLEKLKQIKAACLDKMFV